MILNTSEDDATLDLIFTSIQKDYHDSKISSNWLELFCSASI
jgi:hypothetical protein